MKVNAACIQLCSGNDMAENIRAAGVLVGEAAARGAQLVALPENAYYMRAEGREAPPRYTQGAHPGVVAAQELAVRHNLWLLVGSVAVAAEDAREVRACNRSLLITPKGYIAAAYDKLHLFDVEVGDGQTYRESERVAPGARAVLAHTPHGYIGLSVCYDVRFPQLYRALAQAGAQILTVPAAFTEVTGRAHWEALLRARAIENGCFVLAPAQCGEHPGGRRTHGHSLIVGPWGEVLAEGSADAPGVVMAELDLQAVADARRRIPSLQHDNIGAQQVQRVEAVSK